MFYYEILNFPDKELFMLYWIVVILATSGTYVMKMMTMSFGLLFEYLT